MVTLYTPGKAYPMREGDIIVACPVCRKQVPMLPYAGDIWQVPFHNEPNGTPCNGIGFKARNLNLNTGGN